jgi:two-component system CheB/CheR fusion protein
LAGVEPHTGAAYVVVTHQAPGRATLLPELLAKRTKLKVQVASDRMRLRPDHVYVSPPGCCVEVEDEMLRLISGDAMERHLPVDHLFRSLAKNEGENSIGVVLSGNGTDGTIGITEIKGASGMVIAQNPDSARYTGMPLSAITTKLVDYVLAPEQMAEQIARYVAGRYRIPVRGHSDEPDQRLSALQRVLLIIRARTGNDFSGYKKSTVERRVNRRMTVHGVPSFKEYAKFLEKTPSEVDALFRELLISVTSFFRDPEAFEALERHLAKLVASRAKQGPLRVWVPGCSTGEEAYSIAIVLKEIQLHQGVNFDAQIFATDLDVGAVDAARTGRYSEGITADVSKDRLERFFVREGRGYRVTKELRELLIFAAQNIIKDPPFTKLDLLSCRNLLIYLEPEVQKRVLSLFSYSMRPSGLLLLGTSESVGGFEDRFVSVDKKWKLFQRRPKVAEKPLPVFPTELPLAPREGRGGKSPPNYTTAARTIGHLAERALIESFVPPSVLVNERGDLLYVQGRTGPFLEPAPGEPVNNVLQMAREGLRLELPMIFRRATTAEGPVVRRGLQVKTNGGFASVCVSARRLDEPETMRGAIMLSFEIEPEQERHPKGKAVKNHNEHKRIKALEEELQRTKESLQGTIEELETSNEELKSTNEELQSTNEELQSANEELETSREEMQSLNEELQTVNAEFEERNRALSQSNDDMQNLLNSTEIATIFLDEKLSIKRFTTQAKKVFSLIDTDIGRPISDLAANLRYDHLVDDARDVLRTLVFREKEVQTKEGSWRQMRVMPYRTHDNLIDGLVITFVDIDRVKRAERDSQEARALAESIVESVGDALLVLDTSLNVLSANRSFYELFRTTAKVVVGEPLHRIGDGSWAPQQLIKGLKTMMSKDDGMIELSLELDVPRVGRRIMDVAARRVLADSDQPARILVALSDANTSFDSRPDVGGEN